jgi:hypothetical protein
MYKHKGKECKANGTQEWTPPPLHVKQIVCVQCEDGEIMNKLMIKNFGLS